MPHHCMNRTVLGIANHDGAFAEYLVIPEENLHLVPGSIRDDVAVFAEPLAAAFRIAEQLTIDGDDEIVVLGDGKLGLLCAQVMWLYSKRLICVGKHAWKLDLLKPLHIQTALNEEFAGIASADIVVEATGSPEGLSRALELVRPEGTIVLKTTSATPVALPMSGAVVNEVKIIGSRCGPFRPALEALALGNVEVRPMVSEVYALGEAVHALERAAADNVIKVLLHI
jgi:threonine dehydrogenase-like Zn-dependent dehydrogenase